MTKYPLAKPFIDKHDEEAVLEVLRSGCLSLGPKLEEFEKQFAKKIGVKYACAVSSGTAGLHLAMIAAGIKEGDEVITSPFSFVASANSILYVGAKPVFVDIDPNTYNIDPKKIEAKITEKTKAIVAVHIFGQSVDMDPIMAIAEKHNLIVVEDACESINATCKGRKVGTFGQSSVFAFYPNKQMTTGEGGMILTDSKEIYELCSILRNQGRSENMQWLDHNCLGYNYRMDEMSAALGISQLRKLDSVVEKRREITGWYNKYFSEYSDTVKTPEVSEYNTHTWFVYVVLLQKYKDKRNDVIKQLADAGISSKPYLPSIHLFDFYKKQFGYERGIFPISENISNSAIALPLYIGLTEADIFYIVDKFMNIIKQYEYVK